MVYREILVVSVTFLFVVSCFSSLCTALQIIGSKVPILWKKAHNVASDMIDNFLKALIEIGSMVLNVNDYAIYTNLKNSFENFCFSSESNKYQLLKFLKDQNFFVMSTNLKFGNTCESRNISGMTVYCENQKNGQFISISLVLKNVIIEHDEIHDVCILYSKFSDKLSNGGIL